jgi:hypothetical protein
MGADTLVVTVRDGILTAQLNGKGAPLPSYVEMWFSWAVQHQENGTVWSSDGSGPALK